MQNLLPQFQKNTYRCHYLYIGTPAMNIWTKILNKTLKKHIFYTKTPQNSVIITLTIIYYHKLSNYTIIIAHVYVSPFVQQVFDIC